MPIRAIKRQLLKVIEWTDIRSGLISYKFPMDDRAEIMNGSQLIVREGQVAVFTKEGRIADVFAPGRHVLNTRNMPILTTLMNWGTGFNSPFKCDVYFVNTTQFTGQKWGTSNPFTMRDADFGMIRIRGFGSYSFRVSDAKLLMIEMLGSKPNFTTQDIQEHLRSIITSNISDIIAGSKYSAIDLSSKLTQFNEIARTALQSKYFDPIGLTLSAFVVENISFPENVEKAIDERSSVGIMSDKMGSFVAMEQARAMRDAAQNPGGMGMMFGMGMMGGGGPMGGFGPMNQAQDRPSNIGQQSGGGGFCSKCGAGLKSGAAFCSGCGQKQGGGSTCSKCNAGLKSGSRFCAKCGTAAQ
jgi:membrane protease subunit (stomatin/prohibitin family)